ncbi:MAG: hypothetical protein JJE16_15135 [Nitrospiraceae bacterium]|nr:hypothetical protein [Nitrospiraceae bacterium]
MEPKLDGGPQELGTASFKQGTMRISRRVVEGRTYLVKKLDQQETELEKLRKEIEASKIAEDEQRRELQHYVMNLDVA